MSWDCFTNSEPLAKKDYNCDACEALLNFSCLADYKGDELKLLETAKAEGWKLKAGTKYMKCSGIFDGSPCVFRGRPEIDAICHKYGVYDL